MKKFTKLTAAILIMSVLAACNTVAGVGKDVSKAGDAIEKTAEKAKK